MKPEMEPKRDSRVVAAQVAMDQLEAMGCERFDIGVKRIDGAMILREGWGARQVLKSLLWLRRENLNRGHIYVRPSGVHGLSLVDDLKAAAIAGMKAEGFEPAVVVETSPGNFQAWLKHGQVLDEATSTRVAKELALRFGGDPGSADWRHFGRLAGFTNPKPNRRLESGLQPFARLVEASGQVYIRAAAFVAEVRAATATAVRSAKPVASETGQGRALPSRCLGRWPSSIGIRATPATCIAPIWLGRGMPPAMGSSAAEIRAELMRARDLSKKGNLKRQREYAERTADKAVRKRSRGVPCGCSRELWYDHPRTIRGRNHAGCTQEARG